MTAARKPQRRRKPTAPPHNVVLLDAYRVKKAAAALPPAEPEAEPDPIGVALASIEIWRNIFRHHILAMK